MNILEKTREPQFYSQKVTVDQISLSLHCSDRYGSVAAGGTPGQHRAQPCHRSQTGATTVVADQERTSLSWTKGPPALISTPFSFFFSSMDVLQGMKRLWSVLLFPEAELAHPAPTWAPGISLGFCSLCKEACAVVTPHCCIYITAHPELWSSL